MCRHTKKTVNDSTKRFLWVFIAFLVGCALLYPSFARATTMEGAMSWAWVKVRGTHIRKGPGQKTPSLGIIRKGHLLLVLGKKGDWVDVQYELGKKGWVFKKNISMGLPEKMAMADRILFLRDTKQGSEGKIELFFNGRISKHVKTFEMRNPPRLIVDIQGLKSGRNKSYVLDNSSLVSKVKIGVHRDMSRFVLFLNNKLRRYSHDVAKNEISLALFMGKSSEAQVKSAKASTSKPKVATQHVKKNSILRITKTGFKDEKDRSIIMLNVSSKPHFYVKFLKGKVALLISEAQIDKRYMRFFDTSEFPTPIKKVEFKNVEDTQTGKRAEVWVTVSKMVPYDVRLNHGVLEWIFKKPKEFIAKAEMKASKNASTKVAASPAKPVTSSLNKVAKSPNTPASVATNTSSGKKNNLIQKPKYTGEKMSFDFQNADIHNVLRLIAQVSHLNIVAGDDVRGKITLMLRDVPWDQALDIILESKGLGKEQIGNVLRIAPKAKLNKEMQEKIASKKVTEKLEPRVTEYIPVNYTTAQDLSVKIKPMLSSRGTVTVDDRTNTLIVKDIRKKITDIKKLVKNLDTPTPEVLIESRIVEASKEFTREVGIKWGANYNAGPQYGNAPSNNFPNQMNVRGGANGQAGAQTGGTTGGPTAGGVLPMVNLPAAAAYGALGVTLEQVVDIFTLDVELTAMEDNGLGKVISSPRIATLDNKPAKIEQGLRIPYLKITEEGTVTTEFIEANLNLEVTPHVSNDKMINMEIKVAKDTPDWTHLVQGVPSIDKKEALTNVMVRDGGVTAIGGIFQIERTHVVHKVPLFGDIPILGWAFKNKRTVRNRKELLIFISPKLIPLKKGVK